MTPKSTVFAIIVSICFSWPVMGQAQVLSPETGKPYTAFIHGTDYEATVGEPFFILLGLAPETLPPGYSVSILIDMIESPEGSKPEVLTGFPKTRLTMWQAGSYTIAVRVSLMSKSSCGGIEAEQIMSKEVELLVADL